MICDSDLVDKRTQQLLFALCLSFCSILLELYSLLKPALNLHRMRIQALGRVGETLCHNKSGPDGEENKKKKLSRKREEHLKQQSTGSPGGDRHSHGEDKEADS